MNNMKVLKVGNKGLYDVFTGEGWEKWTRVQVVKERKQEIDTDEGSCEGFRTRDILSLRYVKGRHLPASFVKQAASFIIPQKGK